MPRELPFKPGEIPELIAAGRMRVVSNPIILPPIEQIEQPSRTDQMIERAKEVLGRDFLGVEAVRNMQNAIRNVDINGLKPYDSLEFLLDHLPAFPYSEEDLQIAKKNREMVVLRAQAFCLTGTETPLTIMNFREFFRKDPIGILPYVFDSFYPYALDWYTTSGFATQPGEIKLGWAIVKKRILPGSSKETWQQQEEILKRYAIDLAQKGAWNTEVHRRTATEAVWDTLLYYINNKVQLLPDNADWTSSPASGSYYVNVGHFTAGLFISYLPLDQKVLFTGVVSSR